MPPGLLAAACGDWGKARLFLQCGGGGIACALFAKGNEEAGGEDRPSAGEGLEEGEGGMALGTLRDGGVEVGDGLQGDAELGNQGLDQQDMGGDDARIGAERCGRLESVAALCDDVCRAYVVVADKGLKGGAARALGRCEGGPATHKVTDNVRLFLLQPVEPLRERVFQCPGAVVRQAPCIPDHAPTMCDELCEGAHGRALRMEWLQLIPRREPQCELQCSVAGIGLSPTRGEGFAVARHGQRMNREEAPQVILAQGEDHRTCVQCEAESHGLTVNTRTQGGDPRVESRGRVLKLAALSFCSASRLEASIMVGIGPVDANKSSQGVV